MLGIIGGSGLYALPAIEHVERHHVATPFGLPSDSIVSGRIAGNDIAFLSRHDVGHRLAPSEIPYAANVCAMKMVGVTRLVSISAVGSLRERLKPRSFVVPDQTIDRTVGRRRSFFGDGAVAHVSLADPFCPELSCWLADCAMAGGLSVSTGGTYVCIEGPQFSTRAESKLFRAWGASIVGMTALPEARLAREAELCYACLAMVTDYDVWHAQEGPVNVQGVLENLAVMTDAVQTIIMTLAQRPSHVCASGCASALEGAIVTNTETIGRDTRKRLDPIASRYW
ncbi:MAG TPA: S-methyl-5'-thioadenosine phosphorylase [Thermomicrobiales bacterium]|nr:S-methyl-5'-thioadenosine phosphorylase [Thermomicrobiales bacterium]